jgi:hypothetical protein
MVDWVRRKKNWRARIGVLAVMALIAPLLPLAAGTAAADPGTASQLGFAQGPGSTTGGVAFNPDLEVAVQDSSGTGVADSGVSVTLTLEPATNGGTLPTGAALTCSGGLTATTGSDGTVDFPSCSVNLVGNYIIQAASAGLTSASSGSFTISVGPPAQVLFTQGPVNIPAGTVFEQVAGGGAPAVQLADAGGNPIPAATNSTAYSFGLIATTSSGANTSLSCSGTGESAVTQSTVDPTTQATMTFTGYKVSPDTTDGTSASFPQCTVDTPGTGDTLVAVASDNTTLFEGNSASFDVAAGTATQLVFTHQPVGANPNRR